MLADIAKACHLFENKLDGVIKVQWSHRTGENAFARI
jgi:hypothetical protein